MPQTGSAGEARVDQLLAKVVLERGLLTRAQLEEAQTEQTLGVARGRKAPRPLGIILAERKVLSDAKVAELVRELERVVAGEEEDKRADVLIGQILIDADLAAPAHVRACLLDQAEMFHEGRSPLPRLGQLLVERGFVTPAEIEQALALQRSMVRVCTKCGKTFSLRGPDAPEACPLCGGALEQAIAQESLTGTSRVVADVPQEKGDEDPRRLGKYEIERVLGRGGCGVVYLAEDRQLGRKVALKFMHRGGEADRRENAHEVERFIREAQVAAKLRHPNIVSIYEAGVIEGQHYIAMEYVQGTSMAQWRKSGSVTIRQQVRVLRDVALAIHYAHEQGVMHRDLKPRNVLVDTQVKAYVADFGLAKKAGGEQDLSASLTLEGAIVGTPAYMSPEQARGKKTIGKKSDLWSLGVMLYEILTGRLPFRGDSPVAILMRVMRDPLVPPSQAAPSVFAGVVYRPLEAVVLRALQKDPAERYASAKQLADDLTKWLKGDDLKVAPRRAGAARRHVVTAVATGLGTLVLLAVLIAAAMRPTVSPQLQRAEQFLLAGDVEEARAIFEQVHRREPGNQRALKGLADVERLENDRLRAENAKLSRNIADKPGDPVPARWLVVGPFGGRQIDAPFPPESGIDLAATLRGARGPVRWHEVNATVLGNGTAIVDLAGEFGPKENVVAYALVHVRSAAGGPVRLHVGSDDGVKLWVNGSLAHRNDVTRGLKPDQDLVEARLQAGWNRLLFKITQGTTGWALSLRVAGPPGLEFDPAGDLPGAGR